MRLFLFFLLMISGSLQAAGLNINEHQLSDKIKGAIKNWDKPADEKNRLLSFNFEQSSFSENSKVARIANVIINIADVNHDRVIDEVDIVYPAPRGGMSSEDLGVRSAVLKAVMGEKLASSKEVEFIKSTTGTRNEGQRAIIAGRYGLASKLLDDGVSQMIVVRNIADLGY